MQVILGPFHPYLEQALVEEILGHKKKDLLRSLLILVPSDSLRRRLKILLAQERGLSLLNVQLLTFHQLSLSLFAETHAASRPVICNDLFLEEVLRHVLRLKEPGTEAFASIEEKVGGCAALWQTLRDMKDGMVDPSLAHEALSEGHFRESSERMASLLTLFRTLLSFCRDRGIEDYSDLDRRAIKQVPSSRFLGRFHRIFYYGFYDLTQVQVDLFHAVVQNYSTTLLFPLFHTVPGHPGWNFAERFYTRYVQGLTGESSSIKNLVENSNQPMGEAPAYRLFNPKSERVSVPLPAHGRYRILSSFGAHDEVAAVAKEILCLVSDQGIGFEEIGVVARNLNPYASIIKEVFQAHQIPITGALEEPLVRLPLAKAVVLLLNLASKDYPRAHLIDLVSSPYFNPDPCRAGELSPRPDLWDLLTRRLGICKGFEEWRRLQRYASRDLLLSGASSEDHPRVIRISAAQIRALWNLFSELYRDFSTLPQKASWSRHCDAWKELLKKYLGISADPVVEPQPQEEIARWEIVEILERLAGLDAIQEDVPLNYFIRTFQHWLERSSIASGRENGRGVAVLNAMAARGLSFRALLLIGLNEGVFPRTIREDAFLRDREREILERDLGYKVSQKLAAFDEERLIFLLLAGAARERLYCLYQRSDESGRVLAPSWYLDELRHAFGSDGETPLQELTVPRGIADKAEVEPFDRADLLLPEELAVRLSLDGSDPASLVETFSPSPVLYQQGRQAVERLDLSSVRLDQFDGVVGPLADYWTRFSKKGLSPTALESYARCPFQFFAQYVLGLERLERPEEIAGPSPAEFGELGHFILKSFYQELIERDFFTGKKSSRDFQEILSAAVQRACTDYESENPVGYPLAWEVLKETLTELLVLVLAEDLAELSRSGYRPIALETEMTHSLEDDWPEPLRGLTLHGRMDRIDWHRAAKGLRVIDYKFKFGGSPSSADKDLYRSALRGERLQPPFYLLLGKSWAAKKEIRLSEPTFEAVFYYLAPHWSEGPLMRAAFGAEAWTSRLGNEIKKTMSYLAEGIQQGRFFIRPDDHCRHCEVAEICRKNHPPSLWRAENDPVTKPHRKLHDKKPKEL